MMFSYFNKRNRFVRRMKPVIKKYNKKFIPELGVPYNIDERNSKATLALVFGYLYYYKKVYKTGREHEEILKDLNVLVK